MLGADIRQAAHGFAYSANQLLADKENARPPHHGPGISCCEKSGLEPEGKSALGSQRDRGGFLHLPRSVAVVPAGLLPTMPAATNQAIVRRGFEIRHDHRSAGGSCSMNENCRGVRTQGSETSHPGNRAQSVAGGGQLNRCVRSAGSGGAVDYRTA